MVLEKAKDINFHEIVNYKTFPLLSFYVNFSGEE